MQPFRDGRRLHERPDDIEMSLIKYVTMNFQCSPADGCHDMMIESTQLPTGRMSLGGECIGGH